MKWDEIAAKVLIVVFIFIIVCTCLSSWTNMFVENR